MISVASLIAAGVAPTQARLFADPLAAACALYAIDTPARMSGFVAQCRVESAEFTRLEEGLYYRSADRIAQVFDRLRPRGMELARLVRNPQALANAAYAGVNGNGDEASGDGWRYRGRGLVQLTGRANYAAAAAALGRPLVDQPELVSLPSDACLAAAWYWHANGCNELADAGDWNAITRRVNGPAMLEAARRSQYSEEALLALA